MFSCLHTVQFLYLFLFSPFSWFISCHTSCPLCQFIRSFPAVSRFLMYFLSLFLIYLLIYPAACPTSCLLVFALLPALHPTLHFFPLTSSCLSFPSLLPSLLPDFLLPVSMYLRIEGRAEEFYNLLLPTSPPDLEQSSLGNHYPKIDIYTFVPKQIYIWIYMYIDIDK